MKYFVIKVDWQSETAVSHQVGLIPSTDIR